MTERNIYPVVYIVDDDASVRHGLITLFEVSGYVVEDFESGEALLERNPEGWGCILLDVRMGGMNGLEVQEALIKRANPMPIIFLTAYSDVPHIVHAVKEGAKDFFIKPVEGGVLVDRVQQVIESYFIKLDSVHERRELVARLAEGILCKRVFD